FEKLPGQKVSFQQPIEQRLNEMISGVRGSVAVKIFGDDADVLVEKAEQVERILKEGPGSKDVSPDQVTKLPVLEVEVRPPELARYGASARAVLDRVEALAGKPVGDIVEPGSPLRFPLTVRLPEGMRRDPQAFGAQLSALPGGERVPLSRLADVRLVEGPAKVNREWNQQRLVVQCNVEGRDVDSFVAEARRRIAEEVSLPSPRYRIEWGGQFENLQRARL